MTFDRLLRALGPAAACCLVAFTGCAGGLIFEDGLLSSDAPHGNSNTLLGRLAAPTSPDSSPPGFSVELAKGRNLEQAAKYDKARLIYERLIAAYPQRHQTYHRLGVVADRQRRHREAEALYGQAIRLGGGDPEVFNDLGYCMYLQGKLEKAKSALLKAVALRPAKARYRNNLGLVLGHLGDCEEALEQFRRGGSEADAYYNLAFIHASRDKTEEAKQCFYLALAVDPAHDRARQALASFEHFDADPRQATQDDPVVADGPGWIPYVEDRQDDAPQQDQATAKATASADRGQTQSLLKRARALVARRTAAQHDQGAGREEALSRRP